MKWVIQEGTKFVLSILTFICLISLSSVGAQTIGVDEVVNRLRTSREQTKDFTADLIQEKKVSLLREKVISKGRIRFKHPNKISIEFFHPESSQMVFDGRTLLFYFKEEKIAERYQVGDNPVIEKYLFFSKDPFQEKLAQWKIAEDWESIVVMEILPKVKEALFVKTRLWVSKKDWMVIGMEMVERNGDTTLLRYSNLKVNSGLTDSDFEIHLPKDVKITDIK